MKDYSSWEDANGQYHLLEDMQEQYIQKCITLIERTNYKTISLIDAENDKEKAVLGKYWYYHYAEGYLAALKQELNIRNRISKNDWPVIEKSCKTCDNENCKRNPTPAKSCYEWSLNVSATDSWSEEDREIYRRAGYINCK